ncbi:Thioredoxin-like protein Clot [Camellia lanceoleosa]|uniref:Thioredoxin-like protein Clot n=1 Tax=Camellia lanceoleosa TaxID=1840588 RepID=A0ACC0IB41_9ERIC|nr:Thioredoxin-like protein Clot [Camellia lanceoleosa]
MPLKMLDATISTFDDVLEKFKSDAPNNKANLILFLADKDPSTSLSWCPDCVRVEPHPWRVDLRFKLTGVPTLIRWEDDAIKGRLEDHEAHLEHKIDALVAGK